MRSASHWSDRLDKVPIFRRSQCDQKIGGRHRARATTSPQVQNRMVEILRMCSRTISNPDTANRSGSQIVVEQALSQKHSSTTIPSPSKILEVFTKNWKSNFLWSPPAGKIPKNQPVPARLPWLKTDPESRFCYRGGCDSYASLRISVRELNCAELELTTRALAVFALTTRCSSSVAFPIKLPSDAPPCATGI